MPKSSSCSFLFCIFCVAVEFFFQREQVIIVIAVENFTPTVEEFSPHGFHEAKRATFLVAPGCEKRVFVWSIDSTAYRGVRGLGPTTCQEMDQNCEPKDA